MQEHLPARRAEWSAGEPSAEERALLERFIDAHERCDAAAAVAIAAQDIRVTMPPNPFCFERSKRSRRSSSARLEWTGTAIGASCRRRPTAIWPALWTFSEVDGVEPTNSRAERGLRGAVIYRKLSLGSQSEAGERTIERLLSASQTCRLQRRSLFAYLADVLAAKARGDPVPSLV